MKAQFDSIKLSQFVNKQINKTEQLNVIGGAETEGGILYTNAASRNGFSYSSDKTSGNTTYFFNKTYLCGGVKSSTGVPCV